MRLVLTLFDNPRTVDLVDHTEAATLADLLDAAYGPVHDLRGPLWVDDASYELDAPLESLTLMEGSTIGSKRPQALELLEGWTLTVLGGTGTQGHCAPAPGEPVSIGRSPRADLTTDSPSASWLHATATLEEEGLRLEDRDSTNGSTVDGTPLDAEGTVLSDDAVVRVGGCTVAVRKDVAEPAAPRPGSLHNVTAAGTVPFNRPPRPGRPAPPRPLALPQRKSIPPATKFSLITVLAPLALALVMIIMMRDLRYALVSLMSPLLAVGTWAEQRRRRAQEVKEADAAFATGLETLTKDLLGAARARRLVMRADTPDVQLMRRRALVPTTTLWQRRAEDPDVLLLTAGTADVHWVPEVDARPGQRQEDEVSALLARASVPGAPAQVDLTGAGVVGIVGDRAGAVALARSLLVQAATHCGPADLTVGVFHDPGRAQEWEWASWLPHTRRLGPEAGRWLGGQRTVSDSLLGRLRDGVESLPTPHVLLLLDSDVLTEGRDSPARALLGRGRAASPSRDHVPRRVSGIVVAAVREHLPAACTTVIEVGEDSTGVLEHPQRRERVEDVALCGASVAEAEQAARALARLEDPELEVPGASLPGLVRLGPLLGLEEVTASQVRRLWGSPGVSTPIGVGERGVMELDVVRDGPHGLVGGTTGSGKSEFLRSLVAGLAARNDPTRLTFILIDFKGGAAFKTCERLPHTIGTISNLDAQMADRALRALEAEMTYRQRLFASAGDGVDNLDAYLATSPSEPVPRLLLVVDEFAMLAKEYPDVLSSLVSVAAVGRTLGVHMVLATQRPAGVVNDDILANTNLRVALRVQSREDSSNVIDVPDAAAIGRHQKGRALIKLGQDDITPVQTALVTGALQEDDRAPVTLRDEDGRVLVAAPGEPGPVEVPSQAPGPVEAPSQVPGPGEPETDLDLLIDAIVAASEQAGISPPRPVWPEPLGPRVDLEGFPASPVPDDPRRAVPQVGGREGDRILFALSDDPDHQRQVVEGWNLAEGNLLLGGVPGYGTTTALASVALAAATQWAPQEMDLVVLDMGTGELTALERLPHTLAYAGTGPGGRERQGRLINYLRAELERRRAGAVGRVTVVLVDGLAALRDEYQDTEGLELLDSFYRVYADGPDLGIHVAVSTSRVKVIPSAIEEVTTQKWLFHLVDRYDYAQAGLKPTEGPPEVPGRAVVSRTRLQTHVATPACTLAEAVDLLRDRWVGAEPKRPVVGELPSEVAVAALEGSGDVSGEPWRLPVGILASDLSTAVLESYEGEHLMVAGPPRSGKSMTLLALAASARQAAQAAGAEIWVGALASRRSPLAAAGPEAGLDKVVTEVSELAVLSSAITVHEGPALLLVDDAERVEDPDGVLSGLLASGPPHLRIAAAGRNDDVRTLYSHWTKTLRRSRCGILLRPNIDLDGDLLGVNVPRRASVPMTTGRGYLCLNGHATLMQTALP